MTTRTPVGIHATSAKALAYRGPIEVCHCIGPCLCEGHDGRDDFGRHCQGHLGPQLDEDAQGSTLRPRWLPPRCDADTELANAIAPDADRVIHGQPTKEELAQGKSFALILLVFVICVASASYLADWLGSTLGALSS